MEISIFWLKWRFITILLCLHSSAKVLGLDTKQVPAMFVFGDSLVDDGNNNHLTSLAKSNYYPYGIDFSQGPSGRFSNGRTIIDFLCEMLAIPYLPPFASIKGNGSAMLNGVNYASAAGGILDESGYQLGERFSLSKQVLNFESNMDVLRKQMGPKNLGEFLARSITIMVLGSNDYINNYLLPTLYTSSFTYSPQDYADFVLNRYTRQILALRSIGLRKFLLAGVGPLGCIPNQLAVGLAPSGQCVSYVNDIVGPFNVGLKSLVEQLNSNHPGSIFVYGNTYGALADMLSKPSIYGFNVTDRACCGIGRNQGLITCLPLSIPCSNRDRYIFWDAFHPTEAVNFVLANRAFTGPPSDCYPINIQQMAEI